MMSSKREMGRNIPQWLKTNQAVGLIGAAGSFCLAVYILLMPRALLKLSDGFYLGFFPLASVSLVLLMTLAMAVDVRRNQIPPELATLSPKQFLAVLLVAAVAGIYFWGMRRVGFLIATPIFIVLSSYALGLRSWRRALISAIIFTVIGFVLVRVLGLESILGPLGERIPF